MCNCGQGFEMKEKFDFEAFAKDVHKNAIEKGFWEGERNESEILMLCVSELGESIDGKISQEKDSHVPDFLNWKVEIGDYVIRVLDYAEFHGKTKEMLSAHLDYPDIYREYGNRLVADSDYISVIISLISKELEELRKPKINKKMVYLGISLRLLGDYFGEGWEHDWQSIIEAMLAKHKYNKNRPYKHGKKF